MIIRTLAWEWN